MKWQPIETAPEDRDVLVWCAYEHPDSTVPGYCIIAMQCSPGRWLTLAGNDVEQPTHWMELPEPPP